MLEGRSFRRGKPGGIPTVLILTQNREVEDNRERGAVSSQNHKLRDTSVEGFGRLVGALLQLASICRQLRQACAMGWEDGVSLR